MAQPGPARTKRALMQPSEGHFSFAGRREHLSRIGAPALTARKRSISAGIQAVKIRKADRVGRFFDPLCSLEISVVD